MLDTNHKVKYQGSKKTRKVLRMFNWRLQGFLKAIFIRSELKIHECTKFTKYSPYLVNLGFTKGNILQNSCTHDYF